MTVVLQRMVSAIMYIITSPRVTFWGVDQRTGKWLSCGKAPCGLVHSHEWLHGQTKLPHLPSPKPEHC